MSLSFRSLLAALAPNRPSPRSPVAGRKPRLENLEDRTLLSATLGDNGMLLLTGTTGNDNFIIRMQSNTSSSPMLQVSDNGGTSFQTFDPAQVKGIQVQGLQGDDTLTVDESNGLVTASGGLPIRFDGGQGQDTLVLSGTPAGTTGVTETLAAGPNRQSGTLTVQSSSGTTTINLTDAEGITDTLAADALTVQTGDRNDLVVLRDGTTVNGLTTNTIQSVTQGSLFIPPGHLKQALRHGDDMNGNRGGDDRGDDNQGGDNRVGDDDLDDDDRGDDDPGGLFGHGLGRGRGNHPGLLSLTFANKTAVTVDTQGGNDLVLLGITQPATGLTSLNLQGGSGFNVFGQLQNLTGVSVNATGFDLTLQNPNDLFIAQLYAQKLDRVADRADLDFWRAFLTVPGGRQAVVKGIEESEEGRDNFVRGLYQRFLGRDAGNDEERFWVDLLQNGQTEEQVLSQILSSPEFLAQAQNLFPTSSSDQAFVQALYQTLLNRTPGQNELNFWMAVLPGFGRSAVAQQFLTAPEFRALAITDLYVQYLGRTPDATGLAFWVSSGQNLLQVLEGIEGSPEFSAQM